jgi:uncharacterized protein YbcC (UPF0753/DUF2309 family)
MKTGLKIMEKKPAITKQHRVELPQIEQLVAKSFAMIAPAWPLQNLIAVNPLRGFERLPIEEALEQGAAYFQTRDLPEGMHPVNRETIKWLQAYCDEGQATIPMPLRNRGFYASWRALAIYDERLHGNNKDRIEWLNTLPERAEQAIAEALLRLSIPKDERELFLTLLLTTLPGWAAYVNYRTEWAEQEKNAKTTITQVDYLAVRLAIICLLWPSSKALIGWHRESLQQVKSTQGPLRSIEAREHPYRFSLLKALSAQRPKPKHIPKAQLLFCIDVRSEPFRRALEQTGDYHTYGIAGFFGLPVQIADSVTEESYASCPVLLKPQHIVHEHPACCDDHGMDHRQGQVRLSLLKRFYQSMKYSAVAPFVLAESLGIAAGAWMLLKSAMPVVAAGMARRMKERIATTPSLYPELSNISFAEQCAYAASALRLIGLTQGFAPLVILCGHGSNTQNNPHASALDCGACGGHHGGGNARILAMILNRREVRDYLKHQGIAIPDGTRFIAAEHNTTTDEVTFYSSHSLPDDGSFDLLELMADIETAREKNSAERLKSMSVDRSGLLFATELTKQRSESWAEVRPEWGLARNAAFIVGPRDITADLDLEGRCFLHSYDYGQDGDGAALRAILTAPMVVAEWINTQYLFSTLDNVAYGGGSKVTSNITGKIGIMQGNASDLMNGLPLQSVYSHDHEPFHQPQRLLTVVYAPRDKVLPIIKTEEVLTQLLGNGWVQLACIDPKSHDIHLLSRKLDWEEVDSAGIQVPFVPPANTRKVDLMPA